MDMRHIHYSYAKMRETNRSYQLRTGQMKLQVRKIEPVQYVDSKGNIIELPIYPILGKCYKHNEMYVICVEATKGNESSRCEACELSFDSSACFATYCGAIDRIDKKYIYLKKHNA